LASPRNAVVLINFYMRKTAFLLCLSLILSVAGKAQQDARLLARLDSMMLVTQEMNLEKILDYTYPKLFTIATREQMADAMKSSFETEDFKTTLDSLKIGKVHPVFSTKEGKYAKISHTMLMRMHFTETIEEEQSKAVIPAMEKEFGIGKVRFDKEKNTIIISLNSEMVAIQDEYAAEWCFVNYNEEDSLVNLLFSKEVIEKLKEYK
jgi:hypothetical protein